jgi:hypothetical protein
VEQKSEAPITTVVSAVSEFTKYISQPRFLSQTNKHYGFSAEHDVFKPYYMYDIIEILLLQAGVVASETGLVIRNKPFHSGIKLQNDIYEVQSTRPFLELSHSAQYLNVGLEFEFQYRMTSKKNFTKMTLHVPLIVFYIEKVLTPKSFIDIRQLRADVATLNPNALLFVITESADKKLLRSYSEIKEICYVTRANFAGTQHKALQPQVFLKIFSKLSNFVQSELMTYDKYVPFGHIELFDKFAKN